jgi:hypothetical protein
MHIPPKLDIWAFVPKVTGQAVVGIVLPITISILTVLGKLLDTNAAPDPQWVPSAPVIVGVVLVPPALFDRIIDPPYIYR